MSWSFGNRTIYTFVEGRRARCRLKCPYYCYSPCEIMTDNSSYIERSITTLVPLAPGESCCLQFTCSVRFIGCDGEIAISTSQAARSTSTCVAPSFADKNKTYATKVAAENQCYAIGQVLTCNANCSNSSFTPTG